MNRRRKLLLKEERSEKETQELEKLEEELDEIPVVESEDALKALEIIKKAASRI